MDPVAYALAAKIPKTYKPPMPSWTDHASGINGASTGSGMSPVHLGGQQFALMGGGSSATQHVVYDAALDTYTTRAAIPTGSTEGWAFLRPDGILFFGGGSLGSQTYGYNSGTGTWSSHGGGGGPRTGGAAVPAKDGYVYLLGGNDSGADPGIARWPNSTAGTVVPTSVSVGGTSSMISGNPRHRCDAICMDDGRMIVAHGSPLSSYYGTHIIVDVAANTQTTIRGILNSGNANYGGVTTLPDGRVLFVGAATSLSPSGTAGKYTEIWDPATNTWELGPTFATSKGSVRVRTSSDGRAVCFSGAVRSVTIPSGLAQTGVNALTSYLAST